MPGLNQTGPMGQGPMTGCRMGRCKVSGENIKNQDSETNNNADENQPNNNYGKGQCMGLRAGKSGRGLGMGRQNRFRAGQ